ncbi:MAG: hypothetical protein WBQ76_15135 [Candidatus Korobacteraceae bacterium]
MKRTLAVAALLLGTAALTGCQSPSQKLADIKAEEEFRAAREETDLLPLRHNMFLCEQHLHMNILHQPRKWAAFAKQHHIDSYPSAMSDANLKDCLAMEGR